MERDNFYKFLRKGGRTEDVAERIIRLVETYASYLEEAASTDLDQAACEDLYAYIALIEADSQYVESDDLPGARSSLWAIRYYYRFTQNDTLANYAALLRESRIERKPFKLADFLGVKQSHIEALQSIRIINTKQMLSAGRTTELRRKLAEQTGVPEGAIEELIRLSDLAQLPGVKGTRARLYHDAGIDSIKKLASMSEDEILEITRRFVEESGFDGTPPLPAEVRHTIETARLLPIIVDLD